jgi:two-component sensor histidine kinase
VTERQRHDAEMEFMVAETRHRMKNLFAVVRAIAMQTETDDRTAGEYRDTPARDDAAGLGDYRRKEPDRF